MNFQQFNLTATYAGELSKYCCLKNQMSVRFYFHILSRFLFRIIKAKTRSNMKINYEKLTLISACTRKRSLSCHRQISLPVHHFSHPKCFQIKNPMVRVYRNLSVRPTIHPSVRPSVCPSVCPSICPSICPSVRLSVHPCTL